MEKRKLVCVVCPRGCNIEVCLEDGKVSGVSGHTCRKGDEYARLECTNPARVLTATVRVDGGHIRMVPVKSDKPVPKPLIFECMKRINPVVLEAPVIIGDIVIENILGTGVNIVATSNIYGVKEND